MQHDNKFHSRPPSLREAVEEATSIFSQAGCKLNFLTDEKSGVILWARFSNKENLKIVIKGHTKDKLHWSFYHE